jgi:hypothetical protein
LVRLSTRRSEAAIRASCWLAQRDSPIAFACTGVADGDGEDTSRCYVRCPSTPMTNGICACCRIWLEAEAFAFEAAEEALTAMSA